MHESVCSCTLLRVGLWLLNDCWPSNVCLYVSVQTSPTVMILRASDWLKGSPNHEVALQLSLMCFTSNDKGKPTSHKLALEYNVESWQLIFLGVLFRIHRLRKKNNNNDFWSKCDWQVFLFYLGKLRCSVKLFLKHLKDPACVYFHLNILCIIDSAAINTSERRVRIYCASVT